MYKRDSVGLKLLLGVYYKSEIDNKSRVAVK